MLSTQVVHILSGGNTFLVCFRATRLRSNGVHAFNQIFERQQLGGEASRHGRRDAKRLVDAAPVVKVEVQGKCAAVAGQLL